MRTYKFLIAYDGTRYQGWQRQPSTEMTIQTQLENVVSAWIGYPVEIHGSGRTDAGVHAAGQTAHMVVSGKLDEKVLLKEANEKLPEDIRILHIDLVKNGFHSRHQAKGKKYVYCVDFRYRPNVFRRKYCYHFPEKLDFQAMEQAAHYLEGRHDFAAFTDRKIDTSTVRTIYKISFEIRGQELFISYFGTGFMYHMVRILTGTILEAGAGRRTAESVREVLESGERWKAGFLAPASGLFLQEVIYEERK